MTVAAATYRALQRRARQDERNTDELLVFYALEGFLARLERSTHRNHLVLKGGVLLASLDIRRPTRDVDFAGVGVDNDINEVLAIINDVIDIDIDDGLVFERASLRAETIRDEDEYSGVRVSASCGLATARIRFHIDINVGDPIWPEPLEVEVPRLLEPERPVVLRGYPMTMALAEKTVTALQRGTASTRWRDFTDIYLLSQTHAIDAGELRKAIEVVADHRAVAIRPLRPVLVGYADVAGTKFASWVRKQQLTDRVPSDFAELLEHVLGFTDPILESEPAAADTTWDPSSAQWATS